MITTKLKMWAGAIGGTLTAVSVMWATLEFAIADGSVGPDEIGSLATAVATFGATVYAIWKAPYQVPATSRGLD
jgi:hypothetical protein